MTDLEQEASHYPNIQFRYTISPSTKIATSRIPLDFRRENLERMIEIGEQDALDAIAMGPGGYRDALLEQYHAREEGEYVELSDIINAKLGRGPTE